MYLTEGLPLAETQYAIPFVRPQFEAEITTAGIQSLFLPCSSVTWVIALLGIPRCLPMAMIRSVIVAAILKPVKFSSSSKSFQNSSELPCELPSSCFRKHCLKMLMLSLTSQVTTQASLNAFSQLYGMQKQQDLGMVGICCRCSEVD